LALQALEKKSQRRRDRVLYELDKAMLLRLTGDFTASNELFESAKQTMQRLAATSITENLMAVTINETGRSYVGQPYEQLLLYAYKTLNYLTLGDINGARVEVLQADVKMREWFADTKWQGIDASVFMRYLSGIVFEINRESSEALIAYRKAYEVLKKNALPIPHYLQQDLLRLTYQLDLKDEHNRYRKQFSGIAYLGSKAEQQQGEVILIFHQGLVSRLREEVITNFSPNIRQHVRIAVPAYPIQMPHIKHAQIHVGDNIYFTEVMQDNDRLARNNLTARMPGIITRATVRVVAKKAAAQSANEQDAFAGFIVDLTGLITEQADTRSWTSLPASIQIARVKVPEGEHRVQVTAPTPGADRLFAYERIVSMVPKQKKVISVHDINTSCCLGEE
jgi:hypothetical protein